jgi:hypothetical protein
LRVEVSRYRASRKIVPGAVSPHPNPSDSTDGFVAGAICTGRDGVIPHVVAAIGEREASSDNEGLTSRGLRKNRKDGSAAPEEIKIGRDALPTAGIRQLTMTVGTAASPAAT